MGGLALFGEQAPTGTGESGVVPQLRAATPAEREQTLPEIGQRDAGSFPVGLFPLDLAPPPPPSRPPEPPPPPAPAEIKVLGWMMSGSVPHVFVEWNDVNYTLMREEAVEDVYRFDGIGGGFAEFTYLPTGEGRRYSVRDPALLE
ncbi:hypothetical protein H0E84_02090 [Luteimonas sp. SJ-92]|uniref:Uncharacterized protein n=1 Tax=Luteimonas salinisoli TaxID=2752307 RepID=A0A853J7S6_9GAMM|nr:hypothetical protein [Luteimonas salinisoli]